MNIIPGYDFGATEVPSYGKFLAQAVGLRITGLTSADLDPTIQTNLISNSPVTGGSGHSAITGVEGALWYSPFGDLFTTTRWTWAGGDMGSSGTTEHLAPCRVVRRFGGWETCRARFTAGTNLNGGAPVVERSVSLAASYLPEAVGFESRWVDHVTTGPVDIGYVGGSPVSGARPSVVGRGGTEQFESAPASIDFQDIRRVLAEDSVNWAVRIVTATGGDDGAIGEQFGTLAPISGNPNLHAAGTWMMWAFGRPLLSGFA